MGHLWNPLCACNETPRYFVKASLASQMQSLMVSKEEGFLDIGNREAFSQDAMQKFTKGGLTCALGARLPAISSPLATNTKRSRVSISPSLQSFRSPQTSILFNTTPSLLCG